MIAKASQATRDSSCAGQDGSTYLLGVGMWFWYDQHQTHGRGVKLQPAAVAGASCTLWPARVALTPQGVCQLVANRQP